MHELPGVAFATKDARDAQGDGRDLLAPADLGLEPLDLERICEVRRYAFREGLELDARPSR
jgi:hypothetical protein